MSELLPPACVEPDRFLVELAFEETSNVPEAVLAHVAGCDRCTRVLRELKEARSLSALPLESPSAAMDENIFAALDAHLAGDKVDRFIHQPEPERALGAERLVRHLSVPPRLRGTEAPAPAVADVRPARPARSRRRWMGGLLAAASVALAAGGAIYLNENGTHSLTAPPADTESAAAEADKAPPAKPEEQKTIAAAKDQAPSAAEKQRAVGGLNDLKSAAGGGLGVSDSLGTRDARLKGTLAPAASGAPRPEPLAKVAEKPAMKEEAAAPKADGMIQQLARAAPAAPPPPPAVARNDAPMAPAGSAGAVATADSGAFRERAETKAKKSVALDSDSAALDKAVGDEAAAPAWSVSLARARAAAARRDHRTAADAFASVLASGDVPANIEEEALKGQLDALLALHRFDEAQAIANRLGSRFPAQAMASERVQRARAEAAPAVAAQPAAAPAAAAPAESADAPAKDKP
jgi:hypothetical protein